MPNDPRRAEVLIDRLNAFTWRNRHWAGPPALAVALLALGAGFHLTAVRWIVAVAAGVGWWAALNSWRSLPSRREQFYWLAVVTAAPGWCLAVTYLGPKVWLLMAGAVALLVLGIPWGVHHRVRRGVAVDREIEAWGDGSAVGLGGTKARGTRAGSGWWAFKVAADQPGRYTLDTYRQARKRIAARFGVRADAVSFTTTDHEGEIEVTVRDAPRKTVTAEPSFEATSIIGAESIGQTDAGDPMPVACYVTGHGAVHSVAVGVTGSGKSGWINANAERVVRAPDAILCMVDLSPGAQELKGWEPACYRFARTPAEAETLFDWLLAVCTDRGHRSTSRLFVPTESQPLISVMVDEAATLFAPQLLPADTEIGDRLAAQRVAAARAAKVEQGVRLFRKYGVQLLLATQYGEVEALGGATTQQQLISGYSAIFRTAKNTDSHRIAPASRGVQAADIPANKPGTCYLTGVTIDGTVQGRVRYMRDEDVTAAVAHWAPLQGSPEPELVALPGGERCVPRPRGRGESAGHGQSPTDFRESRDGETHPVATGTIPDVTEGPRRRLSPEESRQLVMDTLRGFPDGGTVPEIAEACGRGVSIIKARLNELRAAGLVESRGRRQPVWRVTVTGATSARQAAVSGADKATTGASRGR